MGVVYAERPSRSTIIIALVLFVVALGVSIGLYFALRQSGATVATVVNTAYKLVNPPDSLATAAGEIMLPMTHTTPGGTVLWWAFTSAPDLNGTIMSIGIVPVSAGGWNLVLFGDGVCSVFAQSAPAGSPGSPGPPGSPGSPGSAGPPETAVWTSGTGYAPVALPLKLEKTATSKAVETRAPPLTCASQLIVSDAPPVRPAVRPLELTWSVASSDVQKLLAPPATGAQGSQVSKVVVFAPMRGATSSTVWWRAAAQPGSVFESIGVIPGSSSSDQAARGWRLVGIAKATSGVSTDASGTRNVVMPGKCTALAVSTTGSITSPIGATWNVAVPASSAGAAISIPLLEGAGPVAPAIVALPSCLDPSATSENPLITSTTTTVTTSATAEGYTMTAPARHAPWIAETTLLKPRVSAGTKWWRSEPRPASDAAVSGSYVAIHNQKIVLVRGDRTCHVMASKRDADAAGQWSNEFTVAAAGNLSYAVVTDEMPPITCTADYPLSLDLDQSEPALKTLCSVAPATSLVLARMRSAASVWWMAELASGTYASIALIPGGAQSGLSSSSGSSWRLVGTKRSSPQTCVALAVGVSSDAGSPVGATWYVGATREAASEIRVTLAVGSYATVPADATLPQCTDAAVGENPLWPLAPRAYRLEMDLSATGLGLRTILPAPADASSAKIAFLPMRWVTNTSTIAWWRTSARDDSGYVFIAVVPVPATPGSWRLIGIPSTGPCIALAVGKSPESAIARPEAAVWYAGATYGDGTALQLPLVRGALADLTDLAHEVCRNNAAAAARLGLLVEPAAPSAAPPAPVAPPDAPTQPAPSPVVSAVSLSIVTSIQIFQGTTLLLPYVSGSTTRWASSDGGAATCVYVINLTAEPSFLSGLAYPTVTPAWGIFLYTGATQKYRGLAYSTRSGPAPPTTTSSDDPWAFSWKLSTGPVFERTLVRQVFSVTEGGRTQVTQLAYAFPAASPASMASTALWTMPIRLPELTVTTVSTVNPLASVASLASLASYGTDHAEEINVLGNEPTEFPDKELTVGTNGALKYSPEFVGSTVRWSFPGGGATSKGIAYPDIFVQMWSPPQTKTDSPTIDGLDVPQNARWFVYGFYKDKVAVKQYELMAHTTSGESTDTPPTGKVWNLGTRPLRFSLVRLGDHPLPPPT
jgi:hypothetical protein